MRFLGHDGRLGLIVMLHCGKHGGGIGVFTLDVLGFHSTRAIVITQ